MWLRFDLVCTNRSGTASHEAKWKQNNEFAEIIGEFDAVLVTSLSVFGGKKFGGSRLRLGLGQDQ